MFVDQHSHHWGARPCGIFIGNSSCGFFFCSIYNDECPFLLVGGENFCQAKSMKVVDRPIPWKNQHISTLFYAPKRVFLSPTSTMVYMFMGLVLMYLRWRGEDMGRPETQLQLCEKGAEIRTKSGPTPSPHRSTAAGSIAEGPKTGLGSEMRQCRWTLNFPGPLAPKRCSKTRGKGGNLEWSNPKWHQKQSCFGLPVDILR